jgi:hypothetical protein
MATLQELRALKETIPGIQIIETVDSRSGKPIIRVQFVAPTFLDPKRGTKDGRAFYPGPEGYKEAIKHFNFLKNKHKDTIARFGEVTGGTITQKYTEDKLKFTDELIEEIDRLTKDPKNKTIKQVESKLFKEFNIPKYTVAARVDPRNAFFQPDKKFFTIPRDYELYGAPYGKRKVSENKTALRQIIGTKFFANNPNYEKTAGLLTAFYTNPDSEFTKKEKDTMRKFVKDFSITRSFKTGDKSIPARFFKQLDFDFGRKLKDFGKIFNVTEYLQEQIKNPRISGTDKAFYRKELNSFLSNRGRILKPLAEKYPNLFGYRTSPTGNLQFEHRVARALGVQGVSLPKDYIARGSYVPGRFNQAKFFNYDKPLMKLVSEYNIAKKSEKPNVRLKIENLTKDFNKRSGGFLENVGFNFKDKVKITDKSPLVSKLTEADVVLDIDKTVRQSNKFFKSFGDQALKGMPKKSIASDFIVGGEEYGLFKKLIRDIRADATAGGPICSLVPAKRANGGTITCVDAVEEAIQKEPEKLVQKASRIEKFKNTATGFLNFVKKGGKFGAIAAAGAASAGLVKKFMNDDPETYLSNEDQQKNMLIDMVTSPMVDQPDSTPAILDYQLPVLGATAVAGTAAVAPSTIKASSGVPYQFAKDIVPEGFIGPQQKGVGKLRTTGRVLGKGLAALGTPLSMAALEPLHIAGQVQQGDSLGEIATNPWNYAGLAFADDLTKLTTKGLSPGIAKAMRLGISPAALRVGSRFLGMPGLALSLGISGYEMYDDYKKKRGIFSEE